MPTPSVRTVRERVLEPSERVGGRARIGDTTWLLTDAPALVALGPGSIRRYPLDSLRAGDLTGLASEDERYLVTLSGWSEAVRLDTAGRIVGRVRLAGRHASIHDGPAGFLYQLLDLRAGASVLSAGPLEGARTDAGTIRLPETRSDRAVAWAEYYMRCSVPRVNRVACWPANEALIEVIGADGRSQVVRVDALRHRRLNTTAFAADARPIVQDVALDPRGELVVLAACVNGDKTMCLWQRGIDGWLPLEIEVEARMLLEVSPRRVSVLTRAGDVVEVTR